MREDGTYQSCVLVIGSEGAETPTPRTIQYAYELFQFILNPREFLQSTMQQHKSTEMTLERADSHIKVTHPPSLFRLP